MRNVARWSRIGYEIPIVHRSGREEKINRPRLEEGQTETKRVVRREEKRKVTSETASSFEHPKKGNARTPVDLC